MSSKHFRTISILLVLFTIFSLQRNLAVARTAPSPKNDTQLARPQEVSPQAWNRILTTIQDDQSSGKDRSGSNATADYSREIKLLASDGEADDRFGAGVAISGEVLVIGASSDDDLGDDAGAAYIFARNQGGADNWGQVQKLTASDGAANGRFGETVAISGDTVVIGAWGDGDSRGSAYVFERNQGGADNWGQVQKLTADDGAAGDLFGQSVSITSGLVAVGARFDNDDGEHSGSAYIFERNQGGADNWGQVQKLTADDGEAGHYFGTSVAIDNDVVVIGAPSDDENGTDSGSAYLFARNEGGVDNWGQIKKLLASDGAADQAFGDSVSINNDTAVVGAWGGFSHQGSAYIFERNQGGVDNWGQVQKVQARDGTAYDWFGFIVVIKGDTLVVEDPARDLIHIFSRNQDGVDWWGQTQALEISRYGFSVAFSGDTILLGAPSDDNNGVSTGAAYLYPAEDQEFHEICKLNASDPTSLDNFGASVGISGGILVIGSDSYNFQPGFANVFARNSDGSDGVSADTWGYVKKLQASDGFNEDHFGESVAVSGDTLVVGTHSMNSNRGVVYVFKRNQGGADYWGQVQILTASDGVPGDWFGGSVGISGDTIVVGAERASDGGSETGAAYVFTRNQGGADNWGQVQKLTASDAGEYDWFGVSVAISSDTIIVGAQGDDSKKGAAYIFNRNQGGADTWGQVKKITSFIRVSNYHLGRNVSISGDTAVVSAHGENNYRGSAYVFERNQGGADNWGQVEKIFPPDGADNDFFGSSVSISNDIIIIGAYADDDNGSNSGSVYVFTRNQGGADEWDYVQKLTASDGAENDYFGRTAAVAGNTIIVGAEGDYETGEYDGSAYVFTTFQPQKVWFDEAHSNINTVDWNRAVELSNTLSWNPDPNWIYFGKLKTTLAPAYELIRQTVSIDGDALEMYDAVMIANPEQPLAESEIADLSHFVADGGGLILLGDCGFWDPNTALTGRYDIAFVPNCLYAPVDQVNGDMTLANFQSLAPTSGISSFEVNWAQSLNITGDAFELADTGSLNAWRDSNGNDQYDSGEEGTFEMIAGYDNGCGRVAVVSDNSFQDDSFEGRRNDRLMRALLTWVTGGQSCIQYVYLPLVLK